MGNALYHSVQSLFSYRLLSKNTKLKIHKTKNLPVVLYWCDIWSLTLMEVHRLTVSENRVLGTFEHKREEVVEQWRILHYEELHNLYTSLNIKVNKSKRTR
jgi:hypothetical protein